MTKLPDLPSNIDLDALPGPPRGQHPAIYFNDEVVWSPTRAYLALAYTICEASMMNCVGRILWARVIGGQAQTLTIPDVDASCWRKPWARWLSDDVFVFKAQWYQSRIHTPLVAIHVTGGFAVLGGTNNPDSWIDDVVYPPAEYEPYSKRQFREALGRAD